MEFALFLEKFSLFKKTFILQEIAAFGTVIRGCAPHIAPNSYCY